MLAAFSVTLNQSDDRLATAQCLLGFRHAIHVTTLMGMQTQRDAFVTSMAMFTYLHNAADMRQKNVDAVKLDSLDCPYISALPKYKVSPEQINNFISNLNLLDQIGNFELNHVFAHSQSLNSEAIVAFVKSLCKVSMSELQSPTDPRVFSLIEIA
ncbi:hypothetical protein RchiOBHm_Chr5g0020911 [Rosa chinensis]|uniref:Uncharacterized protein n=1 Tax=Rosa chinensis TaxID=74649 RepID=A0A2P6Q7D2_ROSCH|nr:hypothetical protein RchiOBHm_Chr5g0020911 [Rosa chinensis]